MGGLSRHERMPLFRKCGRKDNFTVNTFATARKELDTRRSRTEHKRTTQNRNLVKSIDVYGNEDCPIDDTPDSDYSCLHPNDQIVVWEEIDASERSDPPGSLYESSESEVYFTDSQTDYLREVSLPTKPVSQKKGARHGRVTRAPNKTPVLETASTIKKPVQHRQRRQANRRVSSHGNLMTTQMDKEWLPSRTKKQSRTRSVERRIGERQPVNIIQGPGAPDTVVTPKKRSILEKRSKNPSKNRHAEVSVRGPRRRSVTPTKDRDCPPSRRSSVSHGLVVTKWSTMSSDGIFHGGGTTFARRNSCQGNLLERPSSGGRTMRTSGKEDRQRDSQRGLRHGSRPKYPEQVLSDLRSAQISMFPVDKTNIIARRQSSRHPERYQEVLEAPMRRLAPERSRSLSDMRDMLRPRSDPRRKPRSSSVERERRRPSHSNPIEDLFAVPISVKPPIKDSAAMLTKAKRPLGRRLERHRRSSDSEPNRVEEFERDFFVQQLPASDGERWW